MSTEEPQAPSEPVAPPPPPPQPQPQPQPAPATGPAISNRLLIVIGVVAAIVVAASLVFQNRTTLFGPSADSYTVEAFTPPTEIIAARERVEAREAPDVASPVVVMFGEGATINVTGRVSRGIGNDWYAITWRDRTAFVRQQDAVAGSGAPPAREVREEEPEEELKPEEEIEFPGEEEVVQVEPTPPSTGTLDMSEVNWVREPNARDFARYYPTDALDEGQSGRVVLDCLIRGNGRLDCSVAQESPSGNGFGDAAISISRQVRVSTTLPDGSSAAGRRMRLPLSFRAG